MANVKGQATLDAANARKADEANEKAVALKTPESGYVRPKSLKALESIVETNGLKGAGFWRKAADALLEIKTTKLWKTAKDANGNSYPSFVVYAEDRFGFKKTYAYDLVKAAQRKPEAVTEGTAREEMRQERQPKPLNGPDAVLLMQTAWTKMEDRLGDIRDRAIDHEEFVKGYDIVIGHLGETFREFVSHWSAIEGEAVEVVSPTRGEDEDEPTLPGDPDAKPGHEDD